MLLAALIAAQCPVPDPLLVADIDAGRVRAVDLYGSRVFSHDMTLTGDLNAPWVLAGSVFINGYLQTYAPGGLNVNITRNGDDGQAGVVFREMNHRPDSAVGWAYVNSYGVELARLTAQGSFHGSTDEETEAAFMDVGGHGSSLGCRSSPGGCATTLQGGMVNNSRHGAVTEGNYYGRTDRTGGLAHQTQISAPNSDNFESGGFVVDERGNVRVPKGLVTGLHTENFPFCGMGCRDGGCGTAPKLEFDNSGSTINDGTGSLDGTIGLSAFNRDRGRWWVCTLASWAADGGYEEVPSSL